MIIGMRSQAVQNIDYRYPALCARPPYHWPWSWTADIYSSHVFVSLFVQCTETERREQENSKLREGLLLSLLIWRSLLSHIMLRRTKRSWACGGRALDKKVYRLNETVKAELDLNSSHEGHETFKKMFVLFSFPFCVPFSVLFYFYHSWSVFRFFCFVSVLFSVFCSVLLPVLVGSRFTFLS